MSLMKYIQHLNRKQLMVNIINLALAHNNSGKASMLLDSLVNSRHTINQLVYNKVLRKKKER